MKNKNSDGLADAIVNTARLMRHEGIRLIISTQSPLTMPPELLELATMQVSHRFHSKDWYDYMSKKVPLPKHGFEVVRRLKTGQALLFSRTPGVPSRFFDLGQDTLLVEVRNRMTQDRGQTLTHQSAKLAHTNRALASQHRTGQRQTSNPPAVGAPTRVRTRAPAPGPAAFKVSRLPNASSAVRSAETVTVPTKAQAPCPAAFKWRRIR